MFFQINRNQIILSILFILGSFSLQAKADNHFHHKPFHSHYQPHTYIYYPSQQVYYAPETRLWYWNEGNRWLNAYDVPDYLRINFNVGGIPVQLNASLPYQEHVSVIKSYPYDRQYAFNSRYEKKIDKESDRYYRKHYHHSHRHQEDD